MAFAVVVATPAQARRFSRFRPVCETEDGKPVLVVEHTGGADSPHGSAYDTDDRDDAVRFARAVFGGG